MKIKTIDIVALEWFDRVNGNSYFAGTVTVNKAMKTEKSVGMEFQYGYGDHYKDMAFKALEDAKIIKDREKYPTTGGSEAPFRYCDRKKIILRSTKHENCKRKELKYFASK